LRQSVGKPEIAIGLIDGPVAVNHVDLAEARIREVPGEHAGRCAQTSSAACQHGTFVAGILAARRGSPEPALCPHWTLFVRPIFTETAPLKGEMPTSTPEELARAILDCLAAGARVLNLSVALGQASSSGRRELEEALDQAARRETLVVAAAGNQG